MVKSNKSFDQTHRHLIIFFLGVIFVGEILGLTEQEVGLDGLRCDSCGSECSNMCGSRSFRLCCLNYVKKRSSGSAFSPMEGKRIIPSEEALKMKGRKFRQSSGGGLVSLGSELLPLEEQRFLFPIFAASSSINDAYRYEEEENYPGHKFKII